MNRIKSGTTEEGKEMSLTTLTLYVILGVLVFTISICLEELRNREHDKNAFKSVAYKCVKLAKKQGEVIKGLSIGP